MMNKFEFERLLLFTICKNVVYNLTKKPEEIKISSIEPLYGDMWKDNHMFLGYDKISEFFKNQMRIK